MRMRKRILSVLLAAVLMCTSFTYTSSAQKTLTEMQKTADNAGLKSESEEFILPDIVKKEDFNETAKYSDRAEFYETDLNMFVFRNNDGTYTKKIYSYPVKYIDDAGEIKDITTDIKKLSDGRFETSCNNIITTFSQNLSDGIILSYDDISVKMIPSINSAISYGKVSEKNKASLTSSLSSDSKTVSYPYGNKTRIEYSLTYTGFKEDIVVEEYTGQTEYEFTLYTNGMILKEIDGSYYLVNEQEEIKASIGDIIIFTADEKNNTFGMLISETIREKEEYRLTIRIDDEYLKDDNTAYPIRIDPTIEISYSNNGAGAIEDATINNATGSGGTAGSSYIGKRETFGISRALMKFPGLNLNDISSESNIISAKVTVRDLMCEGTEMSIYAHVFTGNTWTETSLSWSGVNANSYISTPLDTVIMSWDRGVAQTNAHYYDFDITNAVKGWKSGAYDKNKGIIFKMSSAVENGSTYMHRTIASYNRSEHKPVLKVVYNPRISLNYSYLSMIEGTTITITAATYPSNLEVIWSTDNTSVATVSSTGVVTAKKAGKVSVMAAFVDANGVIFSATCTVYVYIPNGVYYIKNYASDYYLHAQSGKALNYTNVCQFSKYSDSTDETIRIRQMWKIYHLGDGRYSIRPMHKLNMALDVTGNNVDIYKIGTTDTLSGVPDYAEWTIEWYSNGYVFRKCGSNDYALQIENASTAINANVIADKYSSSLLCNRWSLIKVVSPPTGILMYDTSSGYTVSAPTKYVTPNETRALSTLNLEPAFYSGDSISQAFFWFTSNSNVSANGTTGEITSRSPGTVTVTCGKNHGNEYYNVQYTIVVTEIPNGTYYIKNKRTERYADIQGPTMSAGTLIHQYEYHGGNSQRWIFTHLGDGTYSIKSANSSSSYYMGVKDDSTANDAAVVLRSGNITSGMKWKIEKTSKGAYKIIPKTGESNNRVLAVGWYAANVNGIDIEQRDYVNDENYKDEWHITTSVNIGFSTDNYTNGCSRDERQSYRYANKFFDELTNSPGNAAFDKVHHYNKDSNKTASKKDFSVNGAISNDIDFMIFIGHGTEAENDKGNYVHYGCDENGTYHTTNCSNSAYNAYSTEMTFGLGESDLRWVWMYTCNFLKTNSYVKEYDLKSMMRGAHIVMGYSTQTTLCDAMAETFAAELRAGKPIIESYFYAGRYGEARAAKENHYQRVLYIPQALNETIYSPKIDYYYRISDVLIITKDIYGSIMV